MITFHKNPPMNEKTMEIFNSTTVEFSIKLYIQIKIIGKNIKCNKSVLR